ncbi:hypothetical protein VPHK406_0157 [Vibrio phage K406]
MKTIITILTIVVLSGCVDARGKRLQDQYCSDKGGVYEYAESASAFGSGFCKDNTRFEYFDINKQPLRPEFYPE